MENNTGKAIITTDNAPAAIGTYSQAVKVGNTVYLSGQVGLVPETMELVSENFEEQLHQVFKNLTAVCNAAGGCLADIVKMQVYLLDMAQFKAANEVMGKYFEAPYPARAAIAVAQLPKAAVVEVDAIMVLAD